MTQINNQLPKTEINGIRDGNISNVTVASVVVCIDNPDNINQFNMLPLRWAYDFYDVIIHSDPKWVMQNGQPTFNFTILITDNEAKWKDIVPPDQLFSTRRLGKTAQNIILNRFLSQHETVNALAVPVWGSNYGDTKHTSYLGDDISGLVVVKPEDGARGICQMVVDFDKISVGAFLRDLYGKTSLKDIHAKYKEHLIVGAGHELYDDEAEGVKKDASFAFQRYVENIEAEYRILTDKDGAIGFACKRVRGGDTEFKQATGATSKVTAIEEVTEEQLGLDIGADWDVFERLLAEVVGPMQSVDLFITKDGKWGICEYCNQYGIEGVPREYYLKSVRDYVEDCIMHWATV